jgi:6-phosphogluconolactonase (cycloisomerase 2 family)
MRLSQHAPARVLALAAALTLTAGAGIAAAHAGPPHHRHHGYSPVVGHLYVNDNSSGSNTIAAYDRHADGTLSPIAGSPFATGGAGTGSVIGSQGALEKTDHGRLLLAVDAGSNQISVLRIERDGALAPVPGGTVSSQGIEPVSIAARDDRVYVANAGAGGSDYTGFALSRDGQLRPLADTTVDLPDGSQPGDVLINRTATRLVGTRVGTSQIDSFVIGRWGRLRAAPGSPYMAQGAGPFGSEFSPTNPSQVFVSNAHGGMNAGTVSAFWDGHDGGLSSIGDGPFANGQTAPCWVEISRDGRFLFTVNTAVPSISSYAIDAWGDLTLIGNTPFAGTSTSGLGPEDARLTPDGSTLWVVDSVGDALSAFHVSGGTVTPQGSTPTALPAGSAPFGIVTN